MGADNHTTTTVNTTSFDSQPDWSVFIERNGETHYTGFSVTASNKIDAQKSAQTFVDNIVQTFNVDTVEKNTYTVTVKQLIV